MRPQQIWWTGCGVIVGVWILALLGMAVVDSQTVTAERVLRFISTHSLESKDTAERARIITELADKVNRLPFDEKQKLRVDQSVRDFYQQMTDTERSRFVELTMQEGIKQMVEAFNRMTPQQQEWLVRRAKQDF